MITIDVLPGMPHCFTCSHHHCKHKRRLLYFCASGNCTAARWTRDIATFLLDPAVAAVTHLHDLWRLRAAGANGCAAKFAQVRVWPPLFVLSEQDIAVLPADHSATLPSEVVAALGHLLI
jgi:hypothetical protein